MHLFRRRPANLPPFVSEYLDAPRPAADTPWREVAYAVLDVEATGLDARRDELLAIGLVEIEAGRIRLDRTWQTLVRPPEGAPVNPDAIRVHGLLSEDVHQAPTEADVLPQLLARLKGRVLVVHVAAIDVGFLSRALRRHHRCDLRGPALDTAMLAMSIHSQRRYSHGEEAPPDVALRALAAQLDLPAYAEHNALNDAITTAQVFLAQASYFEAHGSGTVGRLLKAGGCLR